MHDTARDARAVTIHRIDLAMDLLGPNRQVSRAVARYADRAQTSVGVVYPPSELDDWSCLIGEFDWDALGVGEGTTLAKGYDLNGFGHEWAEVNESAGTGVYRLYGPNTILLGKTGEDLAPVAVPNESLQPTESPRVLGEGEPATVFRYDLAGEFVSAMTEPRDAIPSFYDGLCAQVVADNVLASYNTSLGRNP